MNVLQSYSDALGLLIAALAVAFLISGLDDLIIDLCYCMRRLSRRSPTSRVLRQISLGGEERPIAIMVPAWHEHDVIYSMVRTNRNHIDYIDYTFFIGVYQNDPATLVEALRAREAFPNVVVSIVPHDGPTCKADCLNVLVAAIATHERASGRLFAGVALHDSEDVIHPLELKLFNNLNDFYDFIQLPVYSFRRSPRHFVAGTYMDEFAEFHTKDLEVREQLSGVVPCAGTSAFFSRLVIAGLAKPDSEVFNTSSLTEDYDVAFRLHLLGMKEVFVSFRVDFTIDTPIETALPQCVGGRLPIATREFFPEEFRAAYRQRARWLLGIAFQGWLNFGWKGNLGTKYFFYRDRKGVVTSILTVLAYFVVANCIVLALASTLIDRSLTPGSGGPGWTSGFLSLNLALLSNRLVQRTYFTARIYGPVMGALAGPRMMVSNLLNFFAALRAIYMFADHRFSGRPIVWDKTQHVLPANPLEFAE